MPACGSWSPGLLRMHTSRHAKTGLSTSPFLRGMPRASAGPTPVGGSAAEYRCSARPPDPRPRHPCRSGAGQHVRQPSPAGSHGVHAHPPAPARPRVLLRAGIAAAASLPPPMINPRPVTHPSSAPAPRRRSAKCSACRRDLPAQEAGAAWSTTRLASCGSAACVPPLRGGRRREAPAAAFAPQTPTGDAPPRPLNTGAAAGAARNPGVNRNDHYARQSPCS